MTRDELINEYATRILEGMDFQELWNAAHAGICWNLADYSDKELEDEVRDFYPDLLEEV